MARADRGVAAAASLVASLGGRMEPELQPYQILCLSGSGLTAGRDWPTFRDTNGLWSQYEWLAVASPRGWRDRPEVLLAFLDERRWKVWHASPIVARTVIAAFEFASDTSRRSGVREWLTGWRCVPQPVETDRPLCGSR